MDYCFFFSFMQADSVWLNIHLASRAFCNYKKDNSVIQNPEIKGNPLTSSIDIWSMQGQCDGQDRVKGWNHNYWQSTTRSGPFSASLDFSLLSFLPIHLAISEGIYTSTKLSHKA